MGATARVVSASRRSNTGNCVNGLTQITISPLASTTASAACGLSPTLTRYISGGDTTPTNGEYIYRDLTGCLPVSGGGLYFSDGTLSFQVDNNGLISNVSLCI